MITILIHISRVVPFVLWVCVSHYIITVADITEVGLDDFLLLAIAAIVLTTQVGTSATGLTVKMVVVEVAER